MRIKSPYGTPGIEGVVPPMGWVNVRGSGGSIRAQVWDLGPADPKRLIDLSPFAYRSVISGGDETVTVGYDRGGILPPGRSVVYNGTGQPERIVSPDGAGGTEVHIHLHGPVVGGKAAGDQIVKVLQDWVRRNGRTLATIQ